MPAKVTIANNGPIRIEGDFTIQDADGNLFSFPGRARISLCRCGLSENKPFCDGKHKTGFQSVCPARELPPPPPPVNPVA